MGEVHWQHLNTHTGMRNHLWCPPRAQQRWYQLPCPDALSPLTPLTPLMRLSCAECRAGRAVPAEVREGAWAHARPAECAVVRHCKAGPGHHRPETQAVRLTVGRVSLLRHTHHCAAHTGRSEMLRKTTGRVSRRMRRRNMNAATMTNGTPRNGARRISRWPPRRWLTK